MRGSIRKRGDAWQVRAYVGVNDATGTKRTVARTVRGSKREAERVLSRLLLEVGDGRHVNPGLTLTPTSPTNSGLRPERGPRPPHPHAPQIPSPQE